MKKGFTLIELLVVIAIICILSGIVSVQLNTSRQKAKDVAIKQQLTSLRTRLELVRSNSSDGKVPCNVVNGGDADATSIYKAIDALYGNDRYRLTGCDSGNDVINRASDYIFLFYMYGSGRSACMDSKNNLVSKLLHSGTVCANFTVNLPNNWRFINDPSCVSCDDVN